MRITITIDASEAEAAALVDRLRDVFGDRVQVEHASAEVTLPQESPPAVAESPAVEPPPVEPVEQPAGRGQVFRNPQLTGDQVVYGEWQVGPPEWRLVDRVGVSRPGGETQSVRSELKRPENSFEGYDRYLSPASGSTAVEMGGAFRTFDWEFRQDDVAVLVGRTYDLAAIFHPLVKTRLGDGSEVFMSSEQAGDWMTNLEWRWAALSPAGDVLAADDWQDGETLGTTTFDLPFDRPHQYTWQWTAAVSANVTFALQFRNKWALAVTKVWVHQLTCVER